jgi:hypothetical protein
MVPRLSDLPRLLVLIGLLLPGLLIGCDATGPDPAAQGAFTATLRGPADVEFRGEAVHESVEGEALLGVLTNFSIRLTDQNWSSTRRAIYFVRGTPDELTVGTYPLLDLSGDDPARLNPERVWAYVNDPGDEVAYSRGGELRIVEARGDRIAGTFRFPAGPLSDSSRTPTVWADGSFTSLRR